MSLRPQPDSPATWDAYKRFDVTGRYSRGMNCIGTNRHGKRCAWDIPKVKYDDLRRILDWVETQPPQDAEDYLRDIASLSLCQDYHQNQAYRIAEGWRVMLKEISDAVATTGPTLEEKFQLLEERIGEEQKTKADLQAQVEKYKTQLSSLEISLGGQLHIERQNLEAERRKVEALRNDRDNRLVEASKESEDMKKKEKEKDRIHAQNIAGLENTVAGLESTVEGLENTVVMSTKQKEEQKEQIAGLESTVARLESTVAVLENMVVISTKQGEKQKEEIAKQTEQIAKQEAELKTRTDNIDTLENAKLALLQKVDNLSFLLGEEKKTREGVQTKSEKVESTNSSLLVEIENLNSQIVESTTTIEALKASVAEAERNEQEVSDRAKDLQTRLAEERKAKADLEETGGKLSDKLQSLDAELAARTGSAAALSEEVERLKVANLGLVAERETLQAKLGLEEGELASLFEQLRLSNQRHEDARKRPFRFMTKCWLEKVRTNRKKDSLNEPAFQGKRNTQRSGLASS